MRVQTACAMLLLAAAVVSAQTCTSPSAGDQFATSNYASCATITTCQKALCACTGSTSTDFTGCLRANTKGCTDTQTCYAAYFTCLLTTTAVRSNSSDTCSAYGSALYVAQLAAATATAINTSTLYQSCAYNLCTLRNATGSTSSCSTMESTVCGSSVLLPTATTLAPVSATPVVVVTLRLAGANWSAVLNDPVKKAAAITAITTDLAKLLGIDARFIVIIALSVGSLVVQFSVQDGSGKTAAQLTTAVGTATASSTWLTSTSSVYSAVGSDTISATSAAATTAAPGQTLPPNTPTPATPNTPSPTSSAMSAAGVWAVAAVAAVAALLA